MYVNEYNEGAFYEEGDYILSDGEEKLNVSLIFGRTEKRRKEMPLVPGVGFNLPHGKPYVFQEFPHAMFHRKFGDCIVKDRIEEAQKVKEGWQKTPINIKREEAIIERIADLELELTSLISEFEKITGEDFEEAMEKRRRREQAEAKIVEAKTAEAKGK